MKRVSLLLLAWGVVSVSLLAQKPASKIFPVPALTAYYGEAGGIEGIETPSAESISWRMNLAAIFSTHLRCSSVKMSRISPSSRLNE